MGGHEDAGARLKGCTHVGVDTTGCECECALLQDAGEDDLGLDLSVGGTDERGIRRPSNQKASGSSRPMPCIQL